MRNGALPEAAGAPNSCGAATAMHEGPPHPHEKRVHGRVFALSPSGCFCRRRLKDWGQPLIDQASGCPQSVQVSQFFRRYEAICL